MARHVPLPASDPFRPPPPAAVPPAAAGAGGEATRAGDGRGATLIGVLLLLLVSAVGLALVALVVAGSRPAAPGGDAPAVRPAPPLALTDQDGRPFSLSDELGRPVLVFFGYTHCPDVCPATVGTVNQVLAETGGGSRVVFVSVDPERDDVAALKSYLRYLPPTYTALTGTPAEIRQNADGWGVQYAKQMEPSGNYSMAHTADLYLVDAQGRLRATFPFGTEAGPISAALSALIAETPLPPATPPVALASPTAAPTAAPSSSAAATPGGTPAPSAPIASTGPGAGLKGLVVSSSVWAGGPNPVILAISDSADNRLDGTVPVDVTVTGAGGAAAGPPVRAVAVQPWGQRNVFYVATVTIPSPGGWRLALSTPAGATGSVPVSARDQGATAPLGAKAPDVRTPTLDDVGGVARAVTTQPNPDLRLSQTSTADARAQGKPYVIVIDSARFRVSPLCGMSISMVRYLLDRWEDQVVFVHLEPFVYTIVTEEPVLSGSIDNPPLNRWASAYGLGPEPWTAVSMPWAFVVDGGGVVRAKYQGVIGNVDIDVIVSLIENEGVIGGG